MLLSISFCNFQSFKNEIALKLTLNKNSPVRGWQRLSPSGERVTTALGVFGANAAGKTAFLKPLAFLSWFISQSFSSEPSAKIPVTPHFSTPLNPTRIEIEADDREGVVWRYVLEVTRERVIHEALYKKQSRFKYVFVRDLADDGVSYEIKQQGFGFTPNEARKVRPNASLISTAVQYGVESAVHVADFFFATNINIHGRVSLGGALSVASELFGKNDAIRPAMISLLTSWDLGLSDVAIEELEYKKSDGSTQKIWTSFGKHQTKEGLTHHLPMEQESSGTQSAFFLLSRLLLVLHYGGVAAIDEMESDLHPNLLEPILELFDKESTNPHAAQILFTCHSSKVLDLLQKSQVYFIEKNDCESEAFRGDEIEGLRSDDNLRAKYESGALGAVPKV
ncbi:AAA family ATPase [Pseudoxanthomonas wuyuanensis]|uniref:ATPase AAA-type core domain-containing protein n=1 Tax=Pseudoxanthomonas wuyuanensis TaxID=1073196 RepID=A0A286DF85_9GAMM|nr:ATP-binding protein [Pseudoxanthomonas wuyuanensis]SOD57249.1 hypothetical protein SAMN06296416_11295 [Pseudoxanthomonas wuyuanensis]